ncbi:MAG: glucose 1-dehydrogenase [Spirosomaceae bacterium]|nr:glucose 1-dehydrogenase [Spirosomataceae bacterium]
MEFSEKVVLITGTASGFGRVLAYEFAQKGASLILSDVNEKDGQAVADEINANNGKALFTKCDVSNTEDVKQMVEAGVAKFGKLDICVNNAGIAGNALRTKTHDFEEAAWDKIMDVNGKGVWLCMKYELPHLLANGGGVVINVASVAGLLGVPGNVAYAASKHAVIGITKTAAIEYASKNIRVNAVCPAFTDTAMVQNSIMQDKEYGQRLVMMNPMRRLGEPEEVTSVIMFLCSDQNTFMNGQAIAIDGGLTAM